ncbi:MAG: hypothetical protein ABIB79_02425 [archaeon]
MKRVLIFVLGIIFLVFVLSLVSAATSCVDSDGGKNYYVKGTAKQLDDPSYYSFIDQCLTPNGKALAEYYCESVNHCPRREVYECPKGCLNGVCLTCEPSWSCFSWSACVNGQQTRICNDARNCGNDYNKPHLSQVCASGVCYDSDGGKNYFEEGTCVEVGKDRVVDRCYSFPLRIYERFCKTDGLCGGEWRNCVNGCSDGACLPEESATTTTTTTTSTTTTETSTTCSDGTDYGECSLTLEQPIYCNSAGILINNCTACCGIGLICQTDGACGAIPENTCNDGTNYRSCSLNNTLYCNSAGILINNCSACECGTGLTCEADGICASIPETTCSDGTNYSACSSNKPIYCSASGILINNCTACGCGPGLTCQTNETCALILPDACDGCESEGVCLNYGVKMNFSGVPSYCSDTGSFVAQQAAEFRCENSYECLNNNCSGGFCVGLVREQTNFLWKILCWITNPISKKERQICRDNFAS